MQKKLPRPNPTRIKIGKISPWSPARGRIRNLMRNQHTARVGPRAHRADCSRKKQPERFMEPAGHHCRSRRIWILQRSPEHLSSNRKFCSRGLLYFRNDFNDEICRQQDYERFYRMPVSGKVMGNIIDQGINDQHGKPDPSVALFS